MVMNGFQLRSAEAADASLIKAIIQENRLNPRGLDWQRFVVAVDEQGQFIGCGQVKPHGPHWELASIAVVKSWRKKGVAKTIITHLQEQYGAPLWLMCDARLVPFYTPFGFVNITDPAEMIPYFRRIYRLFNGVLWLIRSKSRLAVMLWSG